MRDTIDTITADTITDDQIEALQNEAGMAGDSLQVAICCIALGLDMPEHAREALLESPMSLHPTDLHPTDARAECARVIADAQAQVD